MFGTNDGLLVPRIPTDAAVARAVSVLGMVNLNRVNCVSHLEIMFQAPTSPTLSIMDIRPGRNVFF